MATVSVLIPLYKPNPQYLAAALESLINQTEQDFEVILCEEPTEVDLSDVLKPHLSDPRFHRYTNEKCLGIGGNWNRCFSYATAPIIAYLFQDDLWHKDYLKTALQIFEVNPQVGFISMNHEYLFEQDLWIKEGYEILNTIKKEILRPGVWPGRELLTMWLNRQMHPNIIGEPPFVVLRKKVMSEVGPFNEHMPQFLDVEYWLRCLQVTDWYYEEKVYGSFRVHADSASAKNNESGHGLYDRLTVFETLIASLSGDMKRIAITSRNRSLDDMVKKFLVRVKNKKEVSKKGSSTIVKFVLRHPLVTGTAFIRVLTKRLLSKN